MDKRLAVFFQLFNEIGIISQLSRAMFEARLEDGFLLPHFSVLNHLVRVGDGKTPLELSRAFQVPKASMTHTLTRLADAGHIEMQENQRDRRSKLVHITDSGRRFRETAILGLAPDIDVIARHLRIEDAEAVLPVLQRLRETLDETRD